MQLYVSQMDAVCFDHELFQAFFRLFSSRHSGTGWSYFQLSKECFSRSLLACLDAGSFAACGEASVFALVKSSLDFRHVCLLESVLLLAGCCESFF